MSSATKGSENFIVTEVLIAIGLSIAFIIVTFNFGKGFWGNDYVTGFLRCYGGMSIIVFASVFSVGIIGAIRSKQSKQIGSAILYAFVFNYDCVICRFFKTIFSLLYVSWNNLWVQLWYQAKCSIYQSEDNLE
ncbi:MAG TPA: hypothetical protein VGB71_18060 [Flavisolibacter sp.]